MQKVPLPPAAQAGRSATSTAGAVEVPEGSVLTELDIVDDSGACTTMRLKEVLEGHDPLPAAESLSGTAYRAANGSEVRELGRAVPLVQLEDGAVKRMNYRVGSVHKFLTSVAAVCKRGNRVVLDDDGSFIISKRTEETTPIHKKNNTYINHAGQCVEAWQ